MRREVLVGRGVRRLLPVMLLLATAGCSPNDAADDAVDPPLGRAQPQVLPASEALAGADIAGLDPHTMSGAEIEKVIGAGPRCEFRYTSTGKPVLAVRPPATADAAAGVVMLDGDLIALQLEDAETGVALGAGEVSLVLPQIEAAATQAAEQRDATMIFRVGEQMTVGYLGYYSCVEAT